MNLILSIVLSPTRAGKPVEPRKPGLQSTPRAEKDDPIVSLTPASSSSTSKSNPSPVPRPARNIPRADDHLQCLVPKVQRATPKGFKNVYLKSQKDGSETDKTKKVKYSPGDGFDMFEALPIGVQLGGKKRPPPRMAGMGQLELTLGSFEPEKKNKEVKETKELDKRFMRGRKRKAEDDAFDFSSLPLAPRVKKSMNPKRTKRNAELDAFDSILAQLTPRVKKSTTPKQIQYAASGGWSFRNGEMTKSQIRQEFEEGLDFVVMQGGDPVTSGFQLRPTDEGAATPKSTQRVHVDDLSAAGEMQGSRVLGEFQKPDPVAIQGRVVTPGFRLRPTVQETAPTSSTQRHQADDSFAGEVMQGSQALRDVQKTDQRENDTDKHAVTPHIRLPPREKSVTPGPAQVVRVHDSSVSAERSVSTILGEFEETRHTPDDPERHTSVVVGETSGSLILGESEPMDQAAGDLGQHMVIPNAQQDDIGTGKTSNIASSSLHHTVEMGDDEAQTNMATVGSADWEPRTHSEGILSSGEVWSTYEVSQTPAVPQTQYPLQLVPSCALSIMPAVSKEVI
jgi:hypothetical protein